ncbi:MAG: flavodoxin family protein [Christensenellaceae bacterium]
MKAIIIFHSVCGNTYLMAKAFEYAFKKENFEVKLCRVCDEKLDENAHGAKVAPEIVQKIKDVSVMDDVQILKEYDVIVLGSPTYYGNVSAQIKTFMDKFMCFWLEAALQDKLFCAFASAATDEGGAHQCLNAMNIFAAHMGMIRIPPLSTIKSMPVSAYGFTHYSGETAKNFPNEKLTEAMNEYTQKLAELMKRSIKR